MNVQAKSQVASSRIKVVHGLKRNGEITAMALFGDSPLGDAHRRENYLLALFALTALGVKPDTEELGDIIKSEDVALPREMSKYLRADGWNDYIKTHSPSAPGIPLHLRVDEDGCLRPSAELAAFIRRRINSVDGDTGA